MTNPNFRLFPGQLFDTRSQPSQSFVLGRLPGFSISAVQFEPVGAAALAVEEVPVEKIVPMLYPVGEAVPVEEAIPLDDARELGLEPCGGESVSGFSSPVSPLLGNVYFDYSGRTTTEQII